VISLIAELIAIWFILTVALGALVADFYLRKFGSKRKPFPSCLECGLPMVQLRYLGNELPYEIKIYLDKYNLPKHVVRRFICPQSHRELWIAPPVGDRRKSLIVGNRL
jgi:hypothetical protein